ASETFPLWLKFGGLKLLIAWPAFVALGAAVAIMIQRRCRVVPTTGGLVFILAVYALAGTTWWVLMAPDPRHGFGHFVVLGILPGLLLLLRMPAPVEAARPIQWLPISLLAVSLTIALGYSVTRWSLKVGTRVALAGYQPFTVPDINTVRDNDVQRPVNGEDRCFLTPPPCSFYGTSTQRKFGAYVTFVPPR